MLKEARRDVRSEPTSAGAWGRLGAAYQAHRFHDAAAVCYRRAHELAPEDFRWLYFRAIARQGAGAEPDEIVELFGSAAALRADYAALRVRRGLALKRSAA